MLGIVVMALAVPSAAERRRTLVSIIRSEGVVVDVVLILLLFVSLFLGCDVVYLKKKRRRGAAFLSLCGKRASNADQAEAWEEKGE